MEKEPNFDELKSKIKIGVKLWLKFKDSDEGKSMPILGAGWAELLENIKKNVDGSLAQAAKECTSGKKGKRSDGYSYKYAWNILKRIEKRTGFSPVITQKGGTGGGGSVRLNEWGEYLLKTFKVHEKKLQGFKEEL